MVAPVSRTFNREAESFRTYCQRQFDAKLDYTFDSVAILDGILAECYQGLKGMHANEGWTFLNNTTLAGGAYFGEILARNCGGKWTCEGDPNHLQNWTVVVPWTDGVEYKVSVFGSVYNFLLKGPTETLLGVVAPFLSPEGQWPTPKPVRSRPSRKSSRKTLRTTRRH